MSLVAVQMRHPGYRELEKKLKRELGERLSAIQAELLARKISAEDATARIDRAKSTYEKRLAEVRRHPRRGYRATLTAAMVGGAVAVVMTLRRFPPSEVFPDANYLYASYLASLVAIGVIALVQVREQIRLRGRARKCLGVMAAEVVMDAPLAKLTCEVREVSLIAVEVKNQQALATVLDDEGLAEIASNVLDFLSVRVSRYRGALIPSGRNAFIAVFGPSAGKDHARAAVECARAMQAELVHSPTVVSSGGRPAHLGMGISTGKAQTGIVGTLGQQLYVCEGRTAEMARELAAAASWGEVLLSEDLSSRLEGDVKLSPREPLRSMISDSIVRIHAVVIESEAV